MIQILQNYCTEENVGILTEKYHVDCVEYLPSAKEKPYQAGQIFLTIRLDRSLPELDQIVVSNSFMRVLASANQVINGFQGCILKSISYPFDMEENKEKMFIVVTATVEKDSLFQETELAKLGELLEADLVHHKKPPKLKKEPDDIEKEEVKEFKLNSTDLEDQEGQAEQEKNKTSDDSSLKENDQTSVIDDMFDDKDDFMESIVAEQQMPPTENNDSNNISYINDKSVADDIQESSPLDNLTIEEDTKEQERVDSKSSNTVISENNLDETITPITNFSERFAKSIALSGSDNDIPDFELSLAEVLAPIKQQFEKEEKQKQETAQKQTKQDQALDDSLEPNSKNQSSSKDKHSSKNHPNKKDSNPSQKSQNPPQKEILPKIQCTSSEPPKEQIEAYEAATADVPFLNMIDDYVPRGNIEELSDEVPLYEIHEDDYYKQIISSRKTFYNNFTKIIKEMTGLEHLALEKALRDPSLEDSMIDDVERFIAKNIQISENDKIIMLDKIRNALLSYYVLTNAINDPDVTDIRVLSYDNINVKIHGEHYKADGLSFIDEEDYNMFINRIIIRHKLTVNYPILIFTDKDFHPDYILRFNLCLGMLNSSMTPYLHIRKVPKNKVTLTKLIEDGMLDEKIAKYLLDKVMTSRGIVFSGPSASGKTTLMNALVDYVPKKQSILCIQESEELFSHIHPNAYFQHIVKDRSGRTVIGLSELGQNGLLCDSGYFIIGEVKGGEARDLLRASNTGHKCWCSVHAQSSQETIPRLADYVKYGSDYNLTEATRMLKDLEVIVYIQGYRIVEISEIVGYDEDKQKILYKSIYRRDYDKKEIA